MPDTGGRYLSLAVLCEKILQETDGGISLIRIFDRYTIPQPTPDARSTIPASVAIIFRSGVDRGPATVKLKTISPSGTELGSLEFPIQFEGDNERGCAVMFNMGFQPAEQGLFWFDVLIDDDLATRIPLRVIFQRPGAGSSPLSGPPPRQGRG